MKRKLTEKVIASIELPADRAQVVVWDEELPGFGVVVGKTARTFVAERRVDGRKTRTKIGILGRPREDGHAWTVRLARQRAVEVLGDLQSGRVGPRRTGSGPTLRDGLELHTANMRKRGRSARSIHKLETEVPRHLGEWLDRPIVELTAIELQRICDRITSATPARAGSVNPPGAAQANKVIAHVSALWNALDKLHELDGKNPAKRLTMHALKPRDERIDDGAFVDWFTKVTAADMNPVRRDLQLVALFTGIRADGVTHLRWEDLDLDGELLHVRKAKGGRPYTLPLVRTVREILERRRRENAALFAEHGGDAGWCFPSLTRAAPFQVIPVAEPKERRLDKSREDDDGRPVRVQHLPGIHVCRRTFNSVAIEIGVPAEARLALMNHEGKGVNVRHYGRPQNWDYLRACADKIEAALWSRLKPTAKRPRLRAV